MVLHATANAAPARSRLASLTPEPIARAFARMSTAYTESENPVIASLRGFTSSLGRMFDETETARVVRWVKEMDPGFQMEQFLRELREYIVPELVDAYVSADMAALKLWTSEAVSFARLPRFAFHRD